MSEYQKRADDFLREFGIEFKVERIDAKCPPFCEDGKHIHGDRHRVTLTNPRRAGHAALLLRFEFWNSYSDKQAGKLPTSYDVLACVSGDLHCPETLEEFCSEFGYDVDSRKAEATWRRCLAHAKKLQAFFSGPEQATLSEIT